MSEQRPKMDDAMRKQAAMALVDDLVKKGLLDDRDLDDAADDIVKATKWDMYDGYKIARELERFAHWDCDMAIAEAMESFSGLLQGLFDAAEKKWAAENPCEPSFNIGATVRWRGAAAVVHGISKYRPQCYEVTQGVMRQCSYFVVPFEEVFSS